MNNIDIEGLSEDVAAPDFYVTRNEKQVDHWINDEQLMRLSRGGDDRSLEIFLSSSFAALGFAQNFVTAYQGWKASAPLGLDAMGALFFVVAVTLAIYSGICAYNNKSDTDELVAEIKARKPHKVPPAGPRTAPHLNLAPVKDD